MSKIKLLFVFGTRPEAIKMAPLIKECEKNNEVEPYVCLTAQHRDLLDQVIDLFDVKVDYDLNIMKEGQSLNGIATLIITGITEVVEKIRPHAVFVHGDTSTSFASALACFHLQIPVLHVEAGLRTYDLSSPWPEEANRQLTARITKLHFAPTQEARINLINERVADEDIFVTGNTAVDALRLITKKIDTMNPVKIQRIINKITNFSDDSKNLVLITSHRRENQGELMSEIFNQIKEAALESNVNFIFPVHPNPKVRNLAAMIFDGVPNVYIVPPLGYLEFQVLMRRANLILTDSGGIQEEAASLGINLIILRDTTERQQVLDTGFAQIMGKNVTNLASLIKETLGNPKDNVPSDMFGDGYASKRILDYTIKSLFSE